MMQSQILFLYLVICLCTSVCCLAFSPFEKAIDLISLIFGIEREISHSASQQLLDESKASLQRTFVAIKPDGVTRKLVGEVIQRLEEKGLELVGIKILNPSKSLVEAHYAEHKGKEFFNRIVNFIASGKVVAMVWEGQSAIAHVRRLIGATDPMVALPGTIRGDFCTDSGKNVIHASDSVDSAEREIDLWFKPSELMIVR